MHKILSNKHKNTRQINWRVFFSTFYRPTEKDKQLTTGLDNFSKKKSSHPIGHISNEKEKEIHYNSIIEMIQSKVSGVEVHGDNTISIRGSFDTPLFVVDSVVVDYENFIKTEPLTVERSLFDIAFRTCSLVSLSLKLEKPTCEVVSLS